MAFCKYCGKQILGDTCDCAQAVAAAPVAPAPAPVEQPTPAAAPVEPAPAPVQQQEPVQQAPVYQQDPNQQYQYQYQQSAPAAPVLAPTMNPVIQEILDVFKSTPKFFTDPIGTVVGYSKKGSKVSGWTFFAVMPILMFIVGIIVCKSYNDSISGYYLSSYYSLPTGKIAIGLALMIAAIIYVVIDAYVLSTKVIYKAENFAFHNALNLIGSYYYFLSIVYVASFIISKIFGTLGTVVMGAGALFATVMLLAAFLELLGEFSSTKRFYACFWAQIFSAIFSIVVVIIFGTVLLASLISYASEIFSGILNIF